MYSCTENRENKVFGILIKNLEFRYSSDNNSSPYTCLTLQPPKPKPKNSKHHFVKHTVTIIVTESFDVAVR